MPRVKYAAARTPKRRRRYAGLKKPSGVKRRRLSVKAVRKIAKSEVHRMVEDKEYITPIVGDTPGGSPATFGTANFETNNIIDVSAETLNLVTQANGLTQNGRVGNRIRLKSCVLRGTLTPSGIPTMPHYLKMWVVSSKQLPNSCDVAAMRTICSNSFFKTSPTSTSAGMSGGLIDLCRTVNEEQLIVYAQRVFKLGYVSLPATGLQQQGNNDFSYGKTFKLYLGRHMNKNVVYNDVAADPRNKKIFVVMECLPADGSISTNLSYAILNYFIELKYEDI